MTGAAPLHLAQAEQTRCATSYISALVCESRCRIEAFVSTKWNVRFSRFLHRLVAFGVDLKPPASTDSEAHSNCFSCTANPLVSFLKQASPQIPLAFKMLGRDVAHAVRVDDFHVLANRGSAFT